jgi:hypothetical protein
MIEVKPIITKHERNIFLTFPWRIYKDDPLWVPPLLPERAKVIDPQRGAFFKNGYADLFIAWKDGEPVGTIVCSEDTNATKFKGYGECMIGFFECIEDYAVAEALLKTAEEWARARNLKSIYGPYNLDVEDSRGLLIEGRDRPPALLCAHTQPYYVEFFERFGLKKWGEDGLAYSIDIDLNSPRIQRLMRLAERFRLPLITFIDTPGAYPGVGSEERNQSEAIARNLFEMSVMGIPIISCVIGEGGSGGALAIGVCDRLLMLQFSTYSVISPEGCASILWKSADKKEVAADAMNLTADRLFKLKLVDEVLPEPVGGAHRNADAVAATIKTALLKYLGELQQLPPDKLRAARNTRIDSFGVFSEVAS